jgi:hypothetical protein
MAAANTMAKMAANDRRAPQLVTARCSLMPWDLPEVQLDVFVTGKTRCQKL